MDSGRAGGHLLLALIYVFVIVNRGSVYIVNESGYNAFVACTGHACCYGVIMPMALA